MQPGRRQACVRLLTWPLAFAAGSSVSAVAWAQRAELTQLRLERSGDELYLSASLRFELPAPVLDVLEKGIALHFVAEAEIIHRRWYWTDKTVAKAMRYMRLAYQPLTRRWRLNVSPVPITGSVSGVTLNQNFESLDEALDAVRRVARLRLGPVREIGEESEQPVSFKFSLDTSQLPRPFQIGLVGQSDWNLAVEHTQRLPVEVVP